jgi:glutamate--cysteine ligase
VLAIAREVTAIAAGGLKRRAHLDGDGHDETRHLQLVQEIVASGKTAADRVLERFHGPWAGDATHAFGDLAY